MSRRHFNDYLTTLVGELRSSRTNGARSRNRQRRKPTNTNERKKRKKEERIAMFTKTGISKAGLIIAGVTLGWSAGANAQTSARATAQARATAAQQHADAARQRATELARAGGWAYKTGLVDRTQREAARYQEEADRAVAEAQSCPPAETPSPAQAAALARLEELRQAGGWAYKTGAVARAEREVQASATSVEPEPVAPSPAQAAALARLEELRQAGGWAYKTGAVARAEREVQALAAPEPTAICAGQEGQARVLITSKL
jgi:hypothetical protein